MSAAEMMRWRSDLVVSRQGGPDGVSFVIKDPTVERFYRFKEIEHYIAQQFDGATSAEVVRERVQGKFSVTLSAENLEQFIARLRRLGLIKSGEDAAPIATGGRRRMGGDIFALRFRLVDPERFFDWVLPHVRFLFTPWFIVISSALVAAATVVSVVNWPDITRQASGLFQFESLVLAWFVCLLVIAAHECSHGLTCRYFGGRVREIGFLLLYFQPAFFCNVSDAWLFPEKSRRMWVTFAGAYFEVFLWALATLTWRATEPGTWVNHVALVVTVTSAVKGFFNMNPLIKLDGYYLLSDWLELPNLRRKAFAYFGARVSSLWLKPSAAFADATPRDRRIYFLYALLAGMYSYWLLGTVILWFGGVMVDAFQAWGFVLFTTTLALFFRQPVKKLFLPLTTRLRQTLQKKIIVPKRLGFGLGFAALLALAYFCRMDLRVAGPCTVLPLLNADVRAGVEGIIDEVYVDQGDAVRKGTPIAKLSDRDYLVELAKARAEKAARQAQIKLLRAGSRPEQIAVARTQLGKAEELLKFARGNLERSAALVERKFVSEKDLDEARELVAGREKEVDEARDRLTLAQVTARPEEIELLEAELRRVQAQERYVEEQMKALMVVSPIDGVITTPKLKQRVGLNLKKGDPIAEVNAIKDVTVEIAVPETEIADIAVGQPISLKVRAYPRETFAGSVASIAPVVNTRADRPLERTVLVTTRLDNTAGLLKPEMTGNAKIHCGERQVLELIGRRLVRFIRVEFWSWW